MKNLLKGKKKLILLSLFVLFVAAGCANYVDPNTKKTAEEFIIYSTTSFSEVWNEGWFAGIFIWPMAQLINWVGGMTNDAGIAIIVATVVINVIISAFSIKSQIAQQKMQLMQPEMQKIQNKYEGKTDQQSKMRMANEMQALYSKYDINPFTSMLGMFVQFPVIIAIYYAVQRADTVVKGTFMGLDLTMTPLEGLKNGAIPLFIIFILMVVFQYISMKVPTWIAEHKKKKNHVKTKDYANKNSGPDQMKIMSIVSTLMIAFIGFTWPTAMSFYWMVSSIVRIIQNFVIDKFFIKD